MLGSPLTESEAQMALQDMDMDENGRVDFTEFLTCVANKLQDEASEEEIVQAFKVTSLQKKRLVNVNINAKLEIIRLLYVYINMK